MDNAQSGGSRKKINGFKVWVQSLNERPHVRDARRWFQGPHCRDNPDASLDIALDLLIDEAIEDAVKEMKDRNKVFFFLALTSLPLSFCTLDTSFGVSKMYVDVDSI